MTTPPENGQPVDSGAVLAARMVENLVILNQRLEESLKIQAAMIEQMDTLAAYHEVYVNAMDRILEKFDGSESKKAGIRDVAEAMCAAADEIMGEEEDEPGSEDPLVEIRR